MSIDTQIAEAKAALHDLVTGQLARVVVDQSGERVEFTATSVSRLRAYLADLEAQKAATATVRGPMGIVL